MERAREGKIMIWTALSRLRSPLLTTLLVVVTAVLAGCQHEAPFVWVDTMPDEAYEPGPYRIRVGDQLSVDIWNQAQLETEGRVRADGMFTMPLIGDVPVVGLTPSAAADAIAKRLDGLVLDPRVSVAVREGKEALVTVIGEVGDPGQYPVKDGETVLHMLAKAGGLTEFAARDRIFVLRQGPSAQRIRFSYVRMSRGEGRGLEFVLRDGDVIVVE